MAIRNELLGGADWQNGQVLYSEDMNDTFDVCINLRKSDKTSDYTIQQSDNNSIISCVNSITITLPTDVTPNFQVLVINKGTGTITFNSSGDIRSRNNYNLINTQYSAATAIYLGSNEWILFGDLS